MRVRTINIILVCKERSDFVNTTVVEDLNKRRQPLPTLDAVYFIQPKRER